MQSLLAGVGKLDEAYTQLINIRKRAGIEAGSDNLYGLKANMSRTEMFKAIWMKDKLNLLLKENVSGIYVVGDYWNQR
jgi:hypothetical protein